MLSEQEKLKRKYESDWNDVYKVRKINCVICGKEFYTKLSQQKYCGWECSNIAATRNRKANRPQAIHSNVCAVCGHSFTSRRSGAQYCSAACKQSAYRNRVTDN